jgi:hypothetical protein
MGAGWIKRAGLGNTLFELAPISGTTRTNSANATYTIDSTGGGFDFWILHNRAGATSYVMPAQTAAGRRIPLRDMTGAINTLANNVFLVPNGADKFNGSSGFSLTGTVTTNGTTTITGAGTKFQSELAPGMSIIISNQAGVNYIINTIASDTSLTLTAAFTGASASGLTVKRTSLTFAANFGTLYIEGNGTDWTVKGDGTPTVLTYTASSGGTVAPFIPPQGVSQADLTGWGGGGGGGGGQGNAFSIAEGSPTAPGFAGGAGGSAVASTFRGIPVTPLSNNAVTVGTGGVGGTGGGGVSGGPGTPGNKGGGGTPTKCGTLVEFLGASGGLEGGNGAVAVTGATGQSPGGAGYTQGIPSSSSDTTKNIYSYEDLQIVITFSTTANGPALLQAGGMSAGVAGPTSMPGGTAVGAAGTTFTPGGGGVQGGAGTGAATATGTTPGGGGGAAGPGGQGGNGGGGGGSAAGTTGGTGGAAGTGGNGGTAGGTANTNAGGNGGTGGDAVANSGGGGGGGGGAGNSATANAKTGGAGGAGGSGQLIVTYVL